ncbi:iron-containing redox enzyme family protein [Streptomyces sp. NPDC050619]|uniref:iron-containing redox enzyme family protein n=1 Tax=Streptomyces sp. NPDC050619 TaxID=3157214 RepID=UPI00341BB2E3
MSTLPELREHVDAFLDDAIVDFYKTVPYAQHQLNAKDINLDYYKRHNIETILRLRRKRTIDALALIHFTKYDPVRAKAWAHYTDDEMLHDRMFAADLAKVGVSKDEIYSTEPFLSTKLLTGYLQYGIEYENSPLALVASVYFVEYTTTRTQPDWLDNLGKTLGDDHVKGQRAHVGTDLEDDHDDFVWEVLATLVKTPDDEAKLWEHLRHVFWLWKLYFVELHQKTVQGRPDDLIDLPGPEQSPRPVASGAL